METLTAKVTKIIFSSDTGFTIALCEPEGEIYELSIKGLMEVTKNQSYVFEGEIKDDERFGEYFHVYKYEQKKLENNEEIIAYLASSKFEGIGKRTAKKIVDAFGEKTLDVIIYEPEKLNEINISETIIKEITSKHTSDNLLSELYNLLTPLGFSEFLIGKVYQQLSLKKVADPLTYLLNRPYDLISEIKGYTFEKADAIYLSNGGNTDDSERTYALIENNLLEYAYQSGDTKLERSILINKVNYVLKIGYEIVELALDELIEKKKVHQINDTEVMHKDFFKAENAIARNISLRLDALIRTLHEDAIISKISELETRNNINYSNVQKKAIENALTNNFSIITGGPGTGKTTIIKAIATIFEELRYELNSITYISQKIMLCAPTGRAAQRMKEATGYHAKTIHSLLGWDPHKNEFIKGIDEPLSQELVIIDEFSMVDSLLCESLLKAIRPGTMIIIVGDPAQLESVAPGSVMADLLNNQNIPSVKLDLIFRQGEGSSIAKLAQNIDQNKEIEIIKTNDIGYVNQNGSLIDRVVSIQKRSYAAGYDESQLQVLYPKYKGKNGIDNLNNALKPEIIDINKTLTHMERIYQLGDKIMQLKNNYDKDIYNGDIGFITKIYNYHPKGNDLAMQVEIRNKKIYLTKKDLDEITHAYAISIHKSQGSEFNVIIVPVSSESSNMLSKKLLYTAITRTKDKLVIIGELDTFKFGVKENDNARKTALPELLVKYLEVK